MRLGLSPDELLTTGLFPVAYTIGTDFRAAERLALAPILHWNQL